MIHKYCLNGHHIVVDANSGSVHIVDALVYNMLNYLQAPLTSKLPHKLMNYLNCELNEIKEGYDAIYKLYEKGLLFTQPQKPNTEYSFGEPIPIKSACLNVSHDCNLKCKYCFASGGSFGSKKENMSFEVGKRTIDFLILKSLNRKNIEVDFFGGEPLINFNIVKQIVDYTRNVEKKHNKNFRFTITTNGINLDDDKIKYINEQMSNIVLSIDGRKFVNDKMRTKIDGSSSYDIIMPKFKKIVKQREHKNYYIRGTFTKENLDFSNDVLHLADAGFTQISVEPVVLDVELPYAITEQCLPQIFEEYEKLAIKIIERAKDGKYFNFFHFSVNSKSSPCISKRIRGCGCGSEYIAISPNADIYPCHQFVGMKEYVMGNILDGIIDSGRQAQFINFNIYSKLGCENCWAKLYCSGGCNANNVKLEHNILKPYKINCEIQKKRLECAFMLKAALTNLNAQIYNISH